MGFFAASMSGLRFRDATMADKGSILSMRRNVYNGLDYLPDYFDFFLHDNEHRHCIVGEIGNKVIVFGVTLTLDGGKSMTGQAGRVHEKYEGKGYFRALTEHLNHCAWENGCTARVAMVAVDLNKHVRSEKFKKTHVDITSKLHYAGVVTNSTRQKLLTELPPVEQYGDIRDVSKTLLEDIFHNEAAQSYLFPGNRMLLDYVPFESCQENIPLLPGRNVKFYSSLGTTFQSGSGLLSAGSSYACTRPPESYTIDIFGHDYSDLESHVLFHLRKAFERTKDEFCIQIFVEKGYLAQELCKLLTKLEIEKCNWYVEGGVSVKSIVKEVLV